MSISEKTKELIKRMINMTHKKEIIAIHTSLPDESLFAGKVALITGGSSGIGLAIANKLLQNGCKIIIASRNKDKLSKSVNILGGSSYVKSLVIDMNDIESFPDKILEAASLINNRIDILVNSAGCSTHSSFLDVGLNDYEKVMNVNAKGTYFMCQAVAKYMIKNKIEGHILNISSASALRPAWTPYEVSKWAIRGMTLGIADSLLPYVLPYGITVNAIGPGPVATPLLGKNGDGDLYNPINPSNRYATPEEIAELAAFMVSEKGKLIIGDTFYITGGAGTITMHK